MRRIGIRRTVFSALSLCLVMTAGVAWAEPEFPPSFPPDQNQLPQLPAEPDLYGRLPIPTPDQDPWYEAPSELADYAPGQIVRSREVQTRLLGIPFPVYTKQLLFRSNDDHDNPIVTATTVLVPGIPWIGSSRPVVSFQEAIDSTDSSCNPSHTLQVGTMKESLLLQYWLEQGMAINIPDYDGKAVTWITNAEGKMVLDSLRAMKNDAGLGLADSGIALYGYSGGGSATIHAAELRQSYAPDVRLLGSAFGAAPTNLTSLLNYATSPEPGLTGTVSFGAWIGLAMWSRAYPELAPRIDELLTPEGRQILADIQHRCYATLALTGAYRPVTEYLKDPATRLEDVPEFAQVLAENSIGRHVPDTPLLWWHGMWDELIPPSIILPTVDAYWNRGADLRFYTVPAPEHIVNAVIGWIPATAWTSAILRGLPPGPTFKADYQPLPPGFPGA